MIDVRLIKLLNRIEKRKQLYKEEEDVSIFN